MTGAAAEDLMRALHDEHAEALWWHALRLTGGHRPRAQDIVQETLLRAWRHPELFARTDGSARSWLFTVARNIAIDEWRSAARKAEIPTESVPELAVADDTERAVQTWLITEALTDLPSRHRQVLELCFLRGYSVADAAARLGIAEGTVKSRTHYALRALRLVLAERGVTR